MVPSACAAANAQLGIVVPETDMSVGSERDVMVVDMHAGTSPETVTVAEGVSVNMAT